MLIEAVDRAERAVEATLSAANRGAADASGFRRGPWRSEAVDFERHGDGGAQIFVGAAGLTRSDARGWVVPGARSGRPASPPVSVNINVCQ